MLARIVTTKDVAKCTAILNKWQVRKSNKAVHWEGKIGAGVASFYLIYEAVGMDLSIQSNNKGRVMPSGRDIRGCRVHRMTMCSTYVKTDGGASHIRSACLSRDAD